MQPQRLLVSLFFLGVLAGFLTLLPGCVPSPSSPPNVSAPAIPEQRILILDYPATIRAGDSDVVRLTLELDLSGNLTATTESAGKATPGEAVQLAGVYNTHNILAEARLDLVGVAVRPEETVSEPLLPGQKVTFYWSVEPAEVGQYRGMVWFYLRFVPLDGGASTRQALSAQEIEIESTSFWGITAEAARWLGLVGIFLSTILGLPFLEDVLRWFWRRK